MSTTKTIIQSWYDSSDPSWMVSHVNINQFLSQGGRFFKQPERPIVHPSERRWFLWLFACRQLVWDKIGLKTQAMVTVGYDWVDGLKKWEDVLVAGNCPVDPTDEGNDLPPTGMDNAAKIATYPDLLPFRQVQADLLRCVYPTPYKDAQEEFMRWDKKWITPDTREMAKAVYYDYDQVARFFLADRLEDNGCDNNFLLNHLREPFASVHCEPAVEHPRGCWVIDNVLGWECP